MANPLNMFPVYGITYSAMDIESWANPRGWTSYVLRTAVRMAYIMGCFILCYMAPSFHIFISFIGSFMMMFLGMILPPLAYLYEFGRTMNAAKRNALCFILLLNSAIWVIATLESLKPIIHAGDSHR